MRRGASGTSLRVLLERSLDEVLGLGARDQDGGRDLEGKRIKLPAPGNVSYRLPVSSSLDEAAKAHALLGLHGLVVAGVELEPGVCERVSEQDLRVKARRFET